MSSSSSEPPAKRQKKEEAQKPTTCNDEALRILFRYVDFPAYLRLVCKHWNKIYMESFVLSEAVLREMCSYPQQPTKLDPNRARKAILWLSGLATQYNRDLHTMFATRETRQLLIRARYDLSGVEPRQLVSFSYSPYDITIFNDSLFVCDYTSHLRSYSLSNDFQLVRTFAFDHAPFSIACDSSTGNVLVCFRDRHCIRIYKPTGAFIRELGTYGEGPDQLRYPRGIAAKDGLVYVADGENARVSVFSANGVFFQHIGLNQLTSPHSLDLDDEGRLFVTDSAHKVFVFSTVNGALLYSFGDRGLGFGEFNYPRGIAIDKLGNILVCDCDNCRIQVFDSNGQFLHSFGCRDDHSGKPGSLSYPSFISIDSSGNVFVSEWSMKRIQMF